MSEEDYPGTHLCPVATDTKQLTQCCSVHRKFTNSYQRRVFCPLSSVFCEASVGSESGLSWPRLPWPDPEPADLAPCVRPQRCSASTDTCLSPPDARVALFLTLTPLTGKLQSAIPMFSPGYRSVAAATCDTRPRVGPGRDPQRGNQLQHSTFPGQ